MTDFTFTPSQIRAELIDILPRGLVPFITSAPGLGKSGIVSQIAEEFGLELIDIRLSQCTPEDLMGLPMKNVTGDKATFVPFDTFPTASTPKPKSKEGWLIFLDEFNSASRAVLSAAYKIVYDGMVGMEKLHPDVFIVLAGNRDEDNAIVNDIGTALQSRVVHLQMEKSLTDFSRYGYAKGFDSRILGFLDIQPDLLHQFDPNHEDLTFACPRTWEFASKFIKGKDVEEINIKTLAGIISQGPAVTFHSFLKDYGRVPSFNSIMNDPDKARIPDDDGTQWATISMLLAKFDENNFADIATYVRRFLPEMQIVFFRGAANRNVKMTRHPDFKQALKDLKEFIYDDDDSTDLAA